MHNWLGNAHVGRNLPSRLWCEHPSDEGDVVGLQDRFEKRIIARVGEGAHSRDLEGSWGVLEDREATLGSAYAVMAPLAETKSGNF
jgi:hypothetical protein